MDSTFLIKNYKKYVEEVFKEVQGKGVHVYHKIYRLNPNDLIKGKAIPQSESEVLEFVRNIFKEQIEAYISTPSTKRKVNIINGIAELEDESGNYLGRICDDLLEADMNGHNIIIVKKNGDLQAYDGFRHFKRELTKNVSSAKILEGIILITKRDGETGTCDFDGVYLKNNKSQHG